MALIVCPECGKKFSDRAAACPECAFPTSEIIGQSSNASEGQFTIANNAFIDGRYDEAYQIYSQIYAGGETDSTLMWRLGLATGAKDLFAYGIPTSSKELIKSAVLYEKEKAVNIEDYCKNLLSLLDDAADVLNKVSSSVTDSALELLQQSEKTRSAGEIAVDALLTPRIIGERNLYEDRKSLNRNIQITQTATRNIEEITRTIKAFNSYIMATIAETFANNEKVTSELAKLLNNLVSSKSDYYTLSRIAKDIDITAYGAGYGREEILFELKKCSTYYRVNNKIQNQSLFASPAGHFKLTNYKIKFEAAKPVCCFEKSLDDLISVKTGGVANTSIVFKFPENIEVWLLPDDLRTSYYASMIGALLNK